jgi:hypothetical protein
MVPIDAKRLVVAASCQYHSTSLGLLFQVLYLFARPGRIRPVERLGRTDNYGVLGAEDDTPLAAGAFVVVGYQPIRERIVSMSAKRALPLAAPTLATFFFVPYDLELRKDE